MAPITPLENGTKLAKVVKHIVALVYVLAPIVYWGYHVLILGQEPQMLIWILVLTYSFASAYVIFGQEDVDEALDQAQDVTGQSE